jgi:hypothetical protein
MITCQGNTQARLTNEPVLISASARAHTCRSAKPAIASMSLGLPHPPSRRSRIDRSGSFHGRARSCLTGSSAQPQPHPNHSGQFITDKNTCDDVSANKSLFGNENETPSTRSLLTARAGVAGWRGLARAGGRRLARAGGRRLARAGGRRLARAGSLALAATRGRPTSVGFLVRHRTTSLSLLVPPAP